MSKAEYHETPDRQMLYHVVLVLWNYNTNLFDKAKQWIFVFCIKFLSLYSVHLRDFHTEYSKYYKFFYTSKIHTQSSANLSQQR